MIYPIVMYGDAVLRKKASNIEKGTDVKQLVADMFETMYAANGVGLAAPQIGKAIRLFIADGTSMQDDEEGSEDMTGFKKNIHQSNNSKGNRRGVGV